MEKVILDHQDAVVTRRPAPKRHQLSLLPEIMVEPGSKEDWDLLHELHYKAENLGIGARYWKITLRGQTIGVGVMTVPKMLLSGRNELFTHLRPNKDGRDTRMMNKHRAEWLNANVCTNSRLVLDTMYRGAGIAYRAQNLMMRMTGSMFVEFQSSMSKFNPFAAKAGIQFTRPKRSANYERGLALFRRWFEAIPSDFVGVMDELAAMPPKVQEKCVAELRKFYYDFSSMEKSGDNRMNGSKRVEGLATDKLLKNLQQLVFASPLYGVYINPDAVEVTEGSRPKGGKLPLCLPVLAFDNQPASAPLDLSKVPQQ